MLASHSSPVWLRLSKNGNLMATKKQTAANRRNAKRSTGPKTPGGKAASSMNALRHGLRARTVVLPGESREEFDRIHGALEDQYRPQNPGERHLVDQAAIAQWKLVRAEVFEANWYTKAPDAVAHAEIRAAILGRMTQIQCRLERTFFKAYKRLEDIKAAREKQAAQAQEPQHPAADSGQTGRITGKDTYVHPPKLEVRWLDPDTGEIDVFYRSENGKAVEEFSDDSPAPPKPPGKPL